MTKRKISPSGRATPHDELQVKQTRQEQGQQQPSYPSSELQTFTLLNLAAEAETKLIRFVEEDNEIAGPSRPLRDLHNTEVRRAWREKTNGDKKESSRVENWLANLPERFEPIEERQIPGSGEVPRREGDWLDESNGRFPSPVGLIVARECRLNNEGQSEGSRDR